MTFGAEIDDQSIVRSPELDPNAGFVGPWLTASLATIVRIDEAHAIVQPAIEGQVRLVSMPSFMVACDALQIGTSALDDLPGSAVTSLASGQTVRLFDVPNGTARDRLARSGRVWDDHAGVRDRRVRRVSPARIATSFGVLEASAHRPKRLPPDAGVSFCGNTEVGVYISDSVRTCPRDTPLLVRWATMWFGSESFHARTAIDGITASAGRGELTPFVRLDDLAKCPTWNELR